MDLSKAYDCLPHDLLIVKLDAYGVGIDSLTLIYSYLTDRKQKVKVGNSLSTLSGLVSHYQKEFHMDLYLVPFYSISL